MQHDQGRLLAPRILLGIISRIDNKQRVWTERDTSKEDPCRITATIPDKRALNLLLGTITSTYCKHSTETKTRTHVTLETCQVLTTPFEFKWYDRVVGIQRVSSRIL
jgi:hypothetical protein